jgi:hypothetical protein
VLRAVATWVVVAALASVGVAAAVDAIRAEGRVQGEPVQGRPVATPQPPDVRAQLRGAGVHGTLLYADDGCRLRALRLPDLEPTVLPESAGGPVGSADTTEASCEIAETPVPPHRPPFVVRDGDLIRLGEGGSPVTLPSGLPAVQDLAWSPDERWLALATRASIWLLALEEPSRPLIRLPLEARDLAWRG